MSEKSKTGLFFGSFNPIHIGHMILAGYMIEYTDLKEVWFVVSPQNPLKEKNSLLADYHRLAMVNIAVEDDARMRSCNIEFKMPQPSYTIDTLAYLDEKHPDRHFVLIGGTDILPSFHKWKNYKVLLENYPLYIYNRPHYEPGEYSSHKNISFFDAPLLEISASFIRASIKQEKDIRYMLPPRVYEYIMEMHFYEK
ncbi:MAG: nicotinate-nucleotide adenylyltransferase [Bacteroidetes bacterium]|nr:nicotinate-nucleotide adenylyltransferase [Bacteroidota bacterium]MCK5765119.1 nicotinate-nucleotide adenylyltransferase [Bacteroidales bacterium]